MKLKLSKLAACIAPAMVLLLATSSTWAGLSGGNIPEPGMLPLLGLGAVVLIAVAIRNRRNKK